MRAVPDKSRLPNPPLPRRLVFIVRPLTLSRGLYNCTRLFLSSLGDHLSKCRIHFFFSDHPMTSISSLVYCGSPLVYQTLNISLRWQRPQHLPHLSRSLGGKVDYRYAQNPGGMHVFNRSARLTGVHGGRGLRARVLLIRVTETIASAVGVPCHCE